MIDPLAITKAKSRLRVASRAAAEMHSCVHFEAFIAFTGPKKTLKELIRPVDQYHNRRNLYVWMRKPA